MQFAVEHGSAAGVPVVRVVGELDIATAPELQEAVDAALRAAPAALVVDLTPTTFLDSTGARTIAASAKRGRTDGTTVSLVCPAANTIVRRVVDWLQLETVLPVLDDIDDVASPAG